MGPLGARPKTPSAAFPTAWGQPHGGDPLALAKELGITRTDFVDFSVNLNPMGPPPSITAYLEAGVGGASEYPEVDAAGFVEAIAARYEIDPSSIIVGNGSAELLYWLLAFLKPGTVAIEEPSFADYRRAAEANGARVSAVRLAADNGFESRPDQLARAAAEADLVILGRPNNPTGLAVAADRITDLARSNPRTMFIVDEAFIELTAGARRLAGAVVEIGNLLVLNSLTKAYAVPGVRLGFVAAAPAVAARILAARPPWPLSRTQIDVGCMAMAEDRYIYKSCREVRRLREAMLKELERLPWLRSFRSEANFILAQAVAGAAGHDLLRAAASRGFAIRSCASWRGLTPDYYRFAVLREAQNKSLVDMLRTVEEGF